MKQIRSIQELKAICKLEPVDVAIQLNGGCFSRKSIFFYDGIFSILNYIDDSEQELKPEELEDTDKTNIGLAIKKNALWCDSYTL